MLDLIIRGGQVVTPIGAGQMDVGVQGEHIAVVASAGSLDVDAQRIIDATGKIVLPGGIEPHTHIGIPVPELWAGRPEVFTQPPEAASRAAAYGGSPRSSTSLAVFLSPQARHRPTSLS